MTRISAMQSTAVTIANVLALHRLNKVAQKHIVVYELFDFMSKPTPMVLTPSGDSRKLHKPLDSSFDSSIGPIVKLKMINEFLSTALSGGLSAAK